MRLTDEQVTSLIDKFVLAAKSGWREQRLADHREWSQWINPAKLGSISDANLANYFLEYFKRGAGRYFFSAIFRDRIIRDVVRFRQTLQFLLDEKVSVQKRLDDVLDRNGKHHIEGLGKGLATSFLADLDPMRYASWNNKVEMGLNALGRMPAFSRSDTPGACYLKVLKELADIRELRSQVTFIELDLLLHIISAEPEGIAAIEALRRGGTVDVPDTSPPPAVDMEFVLEKYLEEFMEANFGKINFEAKLELYQDEEGSGRQYQTSIGPIDLLAIDGSRKEFVVIELKKGKTGDPVVGQVLRYMGWVNENLLPKHPGYRVRGIVVVREEDEKLRFALSQMPSVTAFVYSVSFDLRPIATKSSAAGVAK
ncbi:MAG: endonuclease NucS domain-containing protein [Terriglobales bacterium]